LFCLILGIVFDFGAGVSISRACNASSCATGIATSSLPASMAEVAPDAEFLVYRELDDVLGLSNGCRRSGSGESRLRQPKSCFLL
jgi:hypothetical protein